MGGTNTPPDEADDPDEAGDGASRPTVPDAFGFGSRPGSDRDGGDDLGPASEDQVETDRDDSVVAVGLAALLAVVGAVLAFVPDPATSALGVVLVATGVAIWVADRLATG